MNFNKNLRNIFLILFAIFALSACSAKKSQTTGDVYTGNETVEYLASGVKDRVFFATNKSSLTSASRETLRKQATYLRKNKKLNVTIEGHADERGTREYNLALGERRANSAKDYLMKPLSDIFLDKFDILSLKQTYGFRPYSNQEEPYVCLDPNNSRVIYNFGHYRYGILAALPSAKIVNKLIN